MKQKQLICSSRMQDFVRLFWERKHAVNCYDMIRSFLLSRNDFSAEYLDLLAQPHFNEHKKEVAWYSSAFENPPRKFSALSEEEQVTYRRILEETLEAYETLVATETVAAEWKALLQTAIRCSDYSNIYCGDQKVVFTNWGSRKKDQMEHEMIMLKMKPQNRRETPTVDQEIKTDEEKITQLVPPEVPPPVVAEKDPPINHEEEPPPPPTTPEEEVIEENVDHEPPTPPSPPKRFSWWKYLLLLPLILLLFFLFKGGCGGGEQTALPPKMGVIPPVKGEDIGSSPDGMTQVVLDRLNVLIKGSKGVEAFAIAFKTHYPNNDYKVIYYDTIIPRVQIQIPKEEKEKLKEELPKLMSEFELFIWDEALFTSEVIPNDPAFNNKKESWYFELCEVFEGWTITKGSEEVIVAIIDDGFDLNHHEFKDKVIKPYDITKGSSKIPRLRSGGEHGTHVAGSAIARANNSVGSCGIAPNCKLMPIKVANDEGVMTTTAIIDAVLYAIINKADVINLSLGMSFSEELQHMPQNEQQKIIKQHFHEEERVWEQIFDLARNQKSIIVLAAGNENILTGIDPMQRHHEGIKVAAVTPDKRKAPFSNYGSYSTVSAPGVEIYSSMPNNKYDFMSGTSMASPIVAGAVALMKSLNKNLTAPQIIKILQSTGLKSPSNVGPILQLGKALNAIGREKDDHSCDEIKQKIDSLLRVVDQLRRQCPELSKSDTLRLPENNSLEDLIGCWRSTTTLESSTGKNLTLYLEFNGTSQGMIYYVDENLGVNKSPTKVSLSNGEMHVEQLEDASSPLTDYVLLRYRFVGKQQDKSKPADCQATCISNPINKIDFQLVRVNNTFQ